MADRVLFRRGTGQVGAGRGGPGPAGRERGGSGAVGRRYSGLWPLAERRLGRVGRHSPHQGVRQGGGLLQGTGGGPGAAGTWARALGLPFTVFLLSSPEERFEEWRMFRAFGQAGAAPADEEKKQQKEQE